MVMDMPIIEPPQTNKFQHEHHMHVPPSEERPWITHLMPNNDKVVGANTEKAAPNMDTNKLSTNGFSSISMPESWTTKQEGATPPGYFFRSDAPHSKNTNISIFSTGRPLNANDEKALQNTIAEAAGKPKLLFDSTWETSGAYINDPTRKAQVAAEMKELAGVLGITQLGDNQFTNNRVPPDEAAPIFHVDRAEIQNINGKQVLSVEGFYTNIKDGSPQRFYSGIFAPQKQEGGSGTVVHEASLQSEDKMQFMANKSPYRKTLNSIGW